MHAYLKLILLMSFPISHISSPIIRQFSEFEESFGVHYLKEIIFKLTELVETEIEDEMTKTKGVIIHDGWTNNGTHYLGPFASYI